MALKMLHRRLATLDTRVAAPAPKVRDPFYDSTEWRDLVRQTIRQRGRRCEDCGEGGRIYADHVVERRDRGAELDPGNVSLRCPTCHGKKTAAERVRRMAERHGRGGMTSPGAEGVSAALGATRILFFWARNFSRESQEIGARAPGRRGPQATIAASDDFRGCAGLSGNRVGGSPSQR